MAREVRLWEWMRDSLKGVKGLHMRRVENLVSTGDPDVDGCYMGRYFEVELKGCDRPARTATVLDFEVRSSQLAYHRRRWRSGGNNWVYIRVGKGKDVMRYLVPGSEVPTLYVGVTEEQLLKLAVLPPIHTAAELLTRIRSRCTIES